MSIQSFHSSQPLMLAKPLSIELGVCAAEVPPVTGDTVEKVLSGFRLCVDVEALSVGCPRNW